MIHARPSSPSTLVAWQEAPSTLCTTFSSSLRWTFKASMATATLLQLQSQVRNSHAHADAAGGRSSMMITSQPYVHHAGHELKGLQAYMNCGISGLRTPLMALVDYKGM